MAQVPNLGQENVHETLRVIIPGYFALFMIFTLYPELFVNTRGIALALGGGIGLGIILNGLNLHRFPINMVDAYEGDKLKYMLDIVSRMGCEEAKWAMSDLEKSTEKQMKEGRKIFRYLYYLWDSFSYGELPDATRARQRMYASLFYLYLNCAWVLIFYICFVILAVSGSWFVQVIPYNINFRYDILRVFLSLVFSVYLWKKAKRELEGSMNFQKTAMCYYSKSLYEKVSKPLKLYYEMKGEGEEGSR